MSINFEFDIKNFYYYEINFLNINRFIAYHYNYK